MYPNLPALRCHPRPAYKNIGPTQFDLKIAYDAPDVSTAPSPGQAKMEFT